MNRRFEGSTKPYELVEYLVVLWPSWGFVYCLPLLVEAVHNHASNSLRAGSKTDGQSLYNQSKNSTSSAA